MTAVDRPGIYGRGYLDSRPVRGDEPITVDNADNGGQGWITAEGWTTRHMVDAGRGRLMGEPQSRWTVCGRLVMRPLLWMPEGLRVCGQCTRRRAAR